MKITRDVLGNFIPDGLATTFVASNTHIPFIALQNTILIQGMLSYSKPDFNATLRKGNTLRNIKDAFEMAYTTRKIPMYGKHYYVFKGGFFTEAKQPLMVMSLKKEIFDSHVSHFEESNPKFSYANYVMFYSTSFFTDPSLTSLNRRLQKEILQSCYEKGIEVRVLPSSEIEKNTFARVLEVKKTTSLSQLEAYMEQVLPNFLHNGGEDTFIEKKFEAVPVLQEELSIEEEAWLYDSPEEILYDEQEEDREEIERHEEATHIAFDCPDSYSDPFSSLPPQAAASFVERAMSLRAVNGEWTAQEERNAREWAEIRLEEVQQQLGLRQATIELIDDTE
jgi:hypothetical protein